jgi:hypothetical protein
MAIDALNAIVALLLTISLAAERLVAALKTLVPWLADEQKDDTGQIDRTKDRWREFSVLLVTFAASWLTAAFLADGGFDLLGMLKIGTGASTTAIPVIIVGVLSSGGSAFWTSILGYIKAVKDKGTTTAAEERLKYVKALQNFQNRA